MKKTLLIIVLAFLTTGPLMGLAQNTGPRTLSGEESTPYKSSYTNFPQSLKIESGKFWVNGNLVAQHELPANLRGIDANYSLQMTSTGQQDLRIYLMGAQYVVHKGRLIEIPEALPSPNQTSNTTSEANNQSKEQYYSTLKNEEPTHFYALKKEAQLYEKCMQLVLEYQMANGSAATKIKEEIRLLLGEQFDMNIRNMEAEVIQLEKEIEAAKGIIENRKVNKTPIIENRLNELTK